MWWFLSHEWFLNSTFGYSIMAVITDSCNRTFDHHFFFLWLPRFSYLESSFPTATSDSRPLVNLNENPGYEGVVSSW